MAHRLCQFSTLPSIILDSEGSMLQQNRAFMEYWNIDEAKLLGPDKYNIFNDPFFHRKELEAALQKALRGTPVRFDAVGYQFPSQYCLPDHNQSERAMKAIFVIPGVVEGQPRSITVYFQAEASIVSNADASDSCEKVASLATALSDLKHEVSNPLLLIIGHAQLLLAKSDRLPAEAVKKLEKILHNAEKIRALLQDRQDLADLLQIHDECGVIEQS